jgi:Tol biopolymer transport system component
MKLFLAILCVSVLLTTISCSGKASPTSPLPNVSAMVFSSNMNGTSNVYVTNQDGSGLTKLTNDNFRYTYPVWSPVRQKFAVVSNRRNLYLMDYDGANLTPLVSALDIYEIKSPVWSPDGSHLVFSATDSLLGNYDDIYSVTGTGINEGLTKLTNTASVSETWPKWSPDGTKIAFLSQTDTQSGRRWGTEVINADGSGRYSLMQDYGGS